MCEPQIEAVSKEFRCCLEVRLSGKTVSEKHWKTVVENQLHVHSMMLLLEGQAEPVDTQAWHCKVDWGYGVLHFLLCGAALFRQLLAYYLWI